MQFRVGDVYRWERSFTPEDVRVFGELSQDKGRHHVEPDAEGRVMLQGLLTASLPTKIGGDLNFFAREMQIEFLRPVYSGERIRCEVTTRKVDELADRTALEFSVTIVNERDKEVARGRITGVIFREDG